MSEWPGFYAALFDMSGFYAEASATDWPLAVRSVGVLRHAGFQPIILDPECHRPAGRPPAGADTGVADAVNGPFMAVTNATVDSSAKDDYVAGARHTAVLRLNGCVNC